MYIFFDVETTWLPSNYKAPLSDSDNRPRMVQIAWLTYDKDWNLLSENSHIIKPEWYIIPENVSNIHRITTEKAEKERKELKEILEKFIQDVESSEYIVAHNISFDTNIIGAELYRKWITNTLQTKKQICTMKDSTNFCKIPSPRWFWYKWPTLSELYNKLFWQDFEDAHDALVDTQACAQCFFELQKLKN